MHSILSPINEKEKCDPPTLIVKAGGGPQTLSIMGHFSMGCSPIPTPFLVSQLQSSPNPRTALHLAAARATTKIYSKHILMGHFSPTTLAVFQISSPPRKPIICHDKSGTLAQYRL